MKSEITDTQIALLLKAALEFNACIVSLASIYYGNMVSKKNRDRFAKDYKSLMAQYQRDLQKIFPEVKENETV